jgi:hypothetical protein
MTEGVTKQQKWLSELSSREIVWLMMQLHERSWTDAWFTRKTAEASIGMLRGELRSRQRTTN